jgi:hypothetical protein
MKYDIGDLIRLTGSFTDLDGNASDPTTITLSIKEPNGDVVNLVYGQDVFVVKQSTGIYYMDFAPAMEGLHYYRFAGTGTVTAAEEMNFYVNKRQTA